MAYWSYCNNCGKWSASAAPLDQLINKNCPYCGKKLNKDHYCGSNPPKNKPKKLTEKNFKL